MIDLTGAALFVNTYKPGASLLAATISQELNRLGAEAFIFGPDFDCSLLERCSLAFSLGGDGTVLFAARILASRNIPIFPINIGTLGFLAAVHPTDWQEVFNSWRMEQIGVSQRLMLETTVERRGRVISQGVCLNDTVISASGISKIIRLQVSDTHVRLGKYQSDGLIVATPTGSTAYSVAAGGPILDPEIEGMIINPICPFTLSNRPIVIPAKETIIVEVEEEQRSGVILTLDGQETDTLLPGDKIVIKRAPYYAQLIASDRRVFYNALRTKLNWSGNMAGSGAADA